MGIRYVREWVIYNSKERKSNHLDYHNETNTPKIKKYSQLFESIS